VSNVPPLLDDILYTIADVHGVDACYAEAIDFLSVDAVLSCERPGTVTAAQHDDDTDDDATAPGGAQSDAVYYTGRSKCRNGHDTAQTGRYRNSGKCVVCVSEQARRAYQKRCRLPLTETYELFLRANGGSVQRARAAVPPPLDWRLPNSPDALAADVADLVPSWLDDEQRLDVVAELMLYVVHRGYLVNRREMREHGRRYAQRISSRFATSIDAPLSTYDGVTTFADVIPADAAHY
jgi:hypothetical protein